MTPFLHFRMWLRTGPVGERFLAFATGAVVVSLLVWASTPFMGPLAHDSLAGPSMGPSAVPSAQATSDPGGGVRPGGPAATGPVAARSGSGQPGNAGAGPRRPVGSVDSNGTALPRGPGSQVTGKACGTRGGSDQGVTATTISVGVVMPDLGAAGNLLALPSAQDQKKAWNAVLGSLNAKGGVACRKVVPTFYSDNVLDSGAEHAACLQMYQDKPFVVFNNLFSTTEQTCIAKGKIPNFWYTPPHTPDVKNYSPYILSWQPDFDRLIHQYVHGAKALGFFSGMKKIGILEQTCFPDENTAIARELAAAGFDPSKTSVFSYGCSSSPQQPQADQQAVLQFQREGVTHVLNVAYEYDVSFSQAADNQGYSPKFARMEDASGTALQGGSTPPGKSFDNTLMIETIQTGAEAGHTPGYQFNQATKDCDKLLVGVGLPTGHSGGVNSLFGIACIDALLFKQMAELAPSLERSQLARGLVQVGPQDLAYPGGPINITDPGLPTGGQLARAAYWHTSCGCWQVPTSSRWRSY